MVNIEYSNIVGQVRNISCNNLSSYLKIAGLYLIEVSIVYASKTIVNYAKTNKKFPLTLEQIINK